MGGPEPVRKDLSVTRGQLRIYLGAAPGVGKTYTMLEEAHRRKARGTDVVVGFVETHGRDLTARMIASSRSPASPSGRPSPTRSSGPPIRSSWST
jgi:K+-sensing histidine kinase KdpD